MTVLTENTITSEITINAPAAKIFDALTDPAQLPQWWGEDGVYHVNRLERDLRVGGLWKSIGKGNDGEDFSVHGVYRVIEPPTRLDYTWNYDWEEGAAETVVRFDLKEQNGHTIVRVTHSGFVNAVSRDNHKEGWARVLGWLAKYVQ